VLSILENPNGYRRDPQPVRQRFSPDAIAAEYERLFAGLLARGSAGPQL
jgi:hypothetical protein